jgi:hypothetical protein
MCFGNPAKSLSIARSRLTPEQWSRFEREFNDFCVVQGLPDKWAYWPTYDWAKWAFFQGRAIGAQFGELRSPPDIAAALKAKLGQKYCPPSMPPRYDWLSPTSADHADLVADAHYEHLAIAMMDDEQAVASLERWKEGK